MWLKPKNIATATVNTVGNVLLSPPIGGAGYFRNHGPRDKRKVALTFDDGPSKPCTEQLLDALAALDVKATFFCVGLNVNWNPDLVARAYAEDHVIGNHSMEHNHKAGIQIKRGDHIDLGSKTISQIIGCKPRLYRPPWGWLTPWEGQQLVQRGYTIVGWDVYTLDWKMPELDGIEIAKNVCAKVRSGSIILLHDSRSCLPIWEKKQTPRIIQHLVPTLREQGYEFVTIPEPLNVAAYASDPAIKVR